MDFSFQDRLAAGHVEILNKYGFTLDASKTGRGKTHISAKVAVLMKQYFSGVAVVCPKSIISKWKTTLEGYGIKPLFVLNRQKLKTGNTEYLRLRKQKVGRSVKRIWTSNLPYDTFVIYDEIHEDAGPSQNAEMLTALYHTKEASIMGLSATVAHTPLKLLVIGEMLGLHKGHDSWGWAMTMECKLGFFGGLEWTSHKHVQEAVLRELHGKIFPERGLRAHDDEVPPGSEYPAYLFCEAIDAEATSKHAKMALEQIDQMVEEDLVKASEKEQGMNRLVEDTRARQIAEIQMSDWLTEQAEQLALEGAAVVIFACYSLTLDAISFGLKGAGIRHAIYDGRVNQTKRDKIHHEFQKNQLPVLLVQSSAGSSSIDLHDTVGGKERHALHLPHYNPQILLQALGRCDRLGRKSAVFQTLLYLNRGIQKEIYQSVTQKINNLSLLTEGELQAGYTFKKK